ncbi:MAG: hypothetical protein IPI67_16260 [Myxococcales bacterium]|nr:hypothetical protein [Myxococcales bacterium]
MTKLGLSGALAVLFVGLGACGGEPDAGTSFERLTPAPKFDGDPANQAVFAVDVSFWETPLSQSEMDCYWDSGVRHVVVGTQVDYITREQLEMAVSRGMTVDAYVYLYWDMDITAQVKQAFARVSGFPIGRMWLDVEQDPGGRGANTLIAAVQQAVAVCQAQGTAECGIYTGPGYWRTHMNDTTAFSDLMLWWAHYDNKTSLSTWAADQFGGWKKPVAKQFATKPLCGVGGTDWNTMQVTATPSVVVDRTPAPDTGQAPVAPAGLWPPNGAVLPVEYAKLMSALVPGAKNYEIGVERWTGAAWIPYFAWKNANAFIKMHPSIPNNFYRFRVRAQNTQGWGGWSEWSAFEYGKYLGTPPSAGTPVAPGADAGPPPTSDGGPPPVADAGAPPPATNGPTNLTPESGVLISTSSVTLACAPVIGATAYEFAIEPQAQSAWAPYFTYSNTLPSRTFYPKTHGAGYRWRVRAKQAGGFGEWSAYSTFQFK